MVCCVNKFPLSDHQQMIIFRATKQPTTDSQHTVLWWGHDYFFHGYAFMKWNKNSHCHLQLVSVESKLLMVDISTASCHWSVEKHAHDDLHLMAVTYFTTVLLINLGYKQNATVFIIKNVSSEHYHLTLVQIGQRIRKLYVNMDTISFIFCPNESSESPAMHMYMFLCTASSLFIININTLSAWFSYNWTTELDVLSYHKKWHHATNRKQTMWYKNANKQVFKI